MVIGPKMSRTFKPFQCQWLIAKHVFRIYVHSHNVVLCIYAFVFGCCSNEFEGDSPITAHA